jgi:hypothetical protein
MSLLPQQIIPPTVPIGTANADGSVTLDKDWFLLLYNLCQQVLGNGDGSSLQGQVYLALSPLRGTDHDRQIADLTTMLSALPDPAGRIATLEQRVSQLEQLVGVALRS